jgi:ketosteroid isomerase-like protein
MKAHVAFLGRYLAALETFASPDALRGFFAPDVVQEEFPNRLFASGRRHDLAAMMAAAEKGPALLGSQTYRLKKVVAEGDEVAAEIEWSGVLKVGFGAVAPGPLDGSLHAPWTTRAHLRSRAPRRFAIVSR